MDRIRNVLKESVILVATVGVICTLVFVTLPEAAFRTFTPDKNIMLIARNCIRITESGFFMFSMFLLMATFTQSVGYISETWAVSLAKLAVNTPLYFILPRFWGLNGVWAVMPFTDFLSGTAAVIAALAVLRKIPKDWIVMDRKAQEEQQKKLQT